MSGKNRLALVVSISILSLVLSTQAKEKYVDLSEILTPAPFEVVDHTPVEIVITFHESVKPQTFQAWLNGRNIKHKFEPTADGVRALVSEADGLRVIDENKHKKCHTINLLITRIKGRSWQTDIDLRLFYVKPATTQNSPPVAEAGPGQSVFVDDMVKLDGSASSDPDGDDITYQWAFESVPQGSMVMLSDPFVVDPCFVPDLPGTYDIQLIVNDGDLDSAPDTVTVQAQAQMVTVPNVVGMSLAEAISLIFDADLITGEIIYDYSMTVPADNVISQDPPDGESVVIGSEVNMVVSLGPEMVIVPYVLGVPLADANSVITDADLVVGVISYEYSMTVPADNVISQDPPDGESVVIGTPVDMIVSLGPEMVQVPDVTGLSETDAIAMITSANLTIGAISDEYSMIVPLGDVISQTPAAGESVLIGSSVDLVISLGPEMVAVPDVIGFCEVDATEAIMAVNLTVGTISYMHSDFVPAGDVIGQDPSEGIMVVIGSSIDLLVSLGPPTPDLFITTVDPNYAGLGDLITITGSGFGLDKDLVSVRFSFTVQGEVLSSEVPVISVDETSLLTVVPLAMPEHSNQVRVVVDGAVSNALSYEVGSLPWDPTPDDYGNETLSLLFQLDELLERVDAKLDNWYVDTGGMTAVEADVLHQTITEIRDVIGVAIADIDDQDNYTLNVLDAMISKAMFGLIQDDLQEAINALEGSPAGSIMCEGQKVNDVLDELLIHLQIMRVILEIVIATLAAACAAAVVASILTLGVGSPLAATICAASTMAAMELAQTVLDIIIATTVAIQALTAAAPTAPVPNTYTVEIRHAHWGNNEPDFVYVQGDTPVLVESFNDFHNEDCYPDGCTISFTIHLYGVPIPIFIPIPYYVVEDLRMTSDLYFPPGPGGESGFEQLGTGDNGYSYFNGLDVNGPGIVRGDYDVQISADCTQHTSPLGIETHTFTLIDRPTLVSFAPGSAQLGDTIEICGEFIPPDAADASELDFGDAIQTPSATTFTPLPPDYYGCYELTVPDTAGQSGIRLIVDGRTSTDVAPFTVDPPILTSLQPDLAMPGEQIQLHGTGFAAALMNNEVTLNGIPVPLVQRTDFGLIFEV
ncbi:MAG: PASTA domain-containing protein, partial [Sedimentisphaerales bacterium]|nr:PASTA domain-containing protein [Sedimentisphaerales bacterium]